MPENESEEKDEFLFVQLIITFQAAAMQQMGKLQNPITKKVERNLDQAQFSIDMLEMIQNKTKNNLSENETKFLEHALYELRMNYLDEVKKDQQEKNTKQKEKAKEPPSVEESEAKQNEQKQEDKDSAQKEKDKTQPGSNDSEEKD